jgi:hypothetical protein
VTRIKTYDLEKRIREAWDDRSHVEDVTGEAWYRIARQECAEVAFETILPVERIIGAVAAISPGLRWSRNIFWARELAVAWNEGRAEDITGVPTYSFENVRKAIRCLAGEDPCKVLSGPKVTAFYALILSSGDDVTRVCIDGHAYALATGWGGNIRTDPFADGLDASKSVRISKPTLRRVHAAYLKLAAKLNVKPSHLQASTWLVRKRWREQGESI